LQGAPAAAALLVLAGCATAPGAGASSGYGGRYDRLNAQCLERNGILRPTGANRGDPALDYACVIHNPGPEVLRR
jgi:hypothetical protein